MSSLSYAKELDAENDRRNIGPAAALTFLH